MVDLHTVEVVDRGLVSIELGRGELPVHVVDLLHLLFAHVDFVLDVVLYFFLRDLHVKVVFEGQLNCDFLSGKDFVEHDPVVFILQVDPQVVKVNPIELLFDLLFQEIIWVGVVVLANRDVRIILWGVRCRLVLLRRPRRIILLLKALKRRIDIALIYLARIGSLRINYHAIIWCLIGCDHENGQFSLLLYDIVKWHVWSNFNINFDYSGCLAVPGLEVLP